MKIYGAIFYVISVVFVQRRVSAKSLIFSKSGDGASGVEQNRNVAEFEEAKDNIVKDNVDSPLNSYKRSIDDLALTPSYKRSLYDAVPRKRSPYGLVYNQGKPIGILEPIAQSFEYATYNNPNYRNLYKSQWIPVKRDLDFETEDVDRDELAGQTSSLHSSNYANVLAKFKVNNKVKHRPYQDFLYSQQVKRDAASEKLVGDLNKRGGFDMGELQNKSKLNTKRYSNNNDKVEEIEENLKDVMSDMGLVEKDKNADNVPESKNDMQKREIYFEDEDLENGLNKIGLTKESHYDRDKKEDAPSIKSAKSIKSKKYHRKVKKKKKENDSEDEMSTNIENNKNVEDKKSTDECPVKKRISNYQYEGESYIRGKRQNKEIERAEDSEIMKGLESSGDLTVSGNKSPLVAVTTADNPEYKKSQEKRDKEELEYEKRLERNIQARINAIKEEVKREITKLQSEDSKLKDIRQKREIANTLLDEETSVLDPGINIDQKLDTYIRKRRDLDQDQQNDLNSIEESDKNERSVNFNNEQKFKSDEDNELIQKSNEENLIELNSKIARAVDNKDNELTQTTNIDKSINKENTIRETKEAELNQISNEEGSMKSNNKVVREVDAKEEELNQGLKEENSESNNKVVREADAKEEGLNQETNEEKSIESNNKVVREIDAKEEESNQGTKDQNSESNNKLIREINAKEHELNRLINEEGSRKNNKQVVREIDGKKDAVELRSRVVREIDPKENKPAQKVNQDNAIQSNNKLIRETRNNELTKNNGEKTTLESNKKSVREINTNNDELSQKSIEKNVVDSKNKVVREVNNEELAQKSNEESALESNKKVVREINAKKTELNRKSNEEKPMESDGKTIREIHAKTNKLNRKINNEHSMESNNESGQDISAKTDESNLKSNEENSEESNNKARREDKNDQITQKSKINDDNSAESCSKANRETTAKVDKKSLNRKERNVLNDDKSKDEHKQTGNKRENHKNSDEGKDNEKQSDIKNKNEDLKKDLKRRGEDMTDVTEEANIKSNENKGMEKKVVKRSEKSTFVSLEEKEEGDEKPNLGTQAPEAVIKRSEHIPTFDTNKNANTDMEMANSNIVKRNEKSTLSNNEKSSYVDLDDAVNVRLERKTTDTKQKQDSEIRQERNEIKEAKDTKSVNQQQQQQKEARNARNSNMQIHENKATGKRVQKRSNYELEKDIKEFEDVKRFARKNTLNNENEPEMASRLEFKNTNSRRMDEGLNPSNAEEDIDKKVEKLQRSIIQKSNNLHKKDPSLYDESEAEKLEDSFASESDANRLGRNTHESAEMLINNSKLRRKRRKRRETRQRNRNRYRHKRNEASYSDSNPEMMNYRADIDEDMDEEGDEMDDDGFNDQTSNYMKKRQAHNENYELNDDSEADDYPSYMERNKRNTIQRVKSDDADEYYDNFLFYPKRYVRKKRQNFNNLAALATREKNVKPFEKKYRRKRLEKNNIHNKKQNIAELSDSDIFGGLPQSYEGELSRFKRVKRSIKEPST